MQYKNESLDNTNNGVSLKIIDTIYYSDGFPQEDWKEIIPRSNYLTQIEDGISGDNKLIFIEGEEDSGKTILAAQFVKKHSNYSISVFFNPLNNLDYHVDYFCTNVVLQISCILKEQISDDSLLLISTEQYRQSLYQLRKFLKKRKRKVHLIIDGLETKVREAPEFIRELFSIIPFGEDLFRIIISGEKVEYLDTYSKLKREDSKSVILSGFSDGEALQYLGVKNTSNNAMGDLYKITKGYPGRLKTLKRIIQSEDYTLDKISENTTYNTWLELDCESIDLKIPEINILISLFSLSPYSYSVEDVSKICLLDIEKAKEIIGSIPILEVSEKYISITSSAHKKYLSNILRGNKQRIEELLITFYAENESLNSLVDLPKLYTEKKEWGKVIELLDDQYISKILERTGSMQIVNDTLHLGVQAAEKANRNADLLKYSIQGSIVNELDNYLFWESEIEARISIQDFIGAISLAESAIILVDRLRLLALIARRQKELFDKVDEVLVNLIQELYNIIDLSSAGNKIYEIVTHLIYAIPNLAIEIIEKSSDTVSDKNINSWVMAKLSIAAIESSSKDGKSDNSKKMEAVQSLNPPAFKQVTQAITFLVGNYSSQKVLTEVQKIPDTEEKLKLLRLWLTNHKTGTRDIDLVISTALDELIKSTSETSITIEVLNELSSQLPYIRDISAKEKLYKRFKTIESDLSDLGMVKDKFIYQLNMFHAEFYLTRNDSIQSLNRILKEIEAIEDILVKLESYAETFSKLTLLKTSALNSKINFVYSRVISLSETLFETTASQYKISEQFLKTIGKRNPKLSLLIISKINNLSYREKGRLLVLESYLDNNLKHISIDILHEFEASIEENQTKKRFYLDILERYSEAKNLHFKIILRLLYYYEKISTLDNLKERIIGYTFCYKIVVKNDKWKIKVANKIENQIYNNWKNLEADWEKIDVGFTLCYELAKYNLQLAKNIFEESEQIKKTSWLDSKLVAYTYLNSIKLVIRAFNGLLSSSSETSDDFRILQDLLSRIPSEIEVLKLWAEIGFWAYKAGRDDIFKKVLNDHVIIITHELVNNNINIESVLNVLTLIHLTDSGLAIKYINKLDPYLREVALENICYFYVTKRNPYDYYEQNVHKYDSSFIDLSKAVVVLGKLETDNIIYYLISHICKAIHLDKELVKAQISTLINDLQIIVDQSFPDPRNIKHDGYKIISELQLAKVSKHLSRQPSFWDSFLTRANEISNLSDKIFVQSILLDDLPFDKMQNGLIEKRNLYDTITKELKSLPAHYEFVQRVIDISDKMYQYDKTTWKKFVEEAFDLSKSLNAGSDVYTSQRSIIDSMYRLDPAFAKELIKRMDKENQQNKINKLLNKHYETLKVADKIKNSKTLIQREKENAHSIVNSVFIALKSLNSEKINPKRLADTLSYLNLGNKLPLHEVFPIYMYFMNNCARMYRSNNEMVNVHRDNYREAVNATNLIQILSQKKKVSEKSYRQFFIDEEFSTNKPIKPKTREATFNFIKSWILENAEDFMIIADPYFEKQDLEILKIIKEASSSIDVDILGSKDYFVTDVENEYRDYWTSISDEEPPFANITFCRTQNNSEPPFHDRWIITKNSGLRIGTSVNSVGHRKESEISVMKPNEALRIREDTLNEYITRRKKEFNKEKLYYKSFSM